MPDVLTTMTHTYQATGIILKGMPLGEYDRLVSILTSEYGLIRAVAPGARKYKSKLRGRCELFVVNQLLIVKGRSLEKIIQAETLESHPGLSRDLGKLSASQYLAELVLLLALSDQPQTELYELLLEHLQRIERQEEPQVLVANIAQAVFHLLAIAGIAPEVHRCCLTQEAIVPNFTDPQWRVGFSFEAGGLISLNPQLSSAILDNHNLPIPKINSQLRIIELILLQQLGNPFLPQLSEIFSHPVPSTSVELSWIRLERLLRDYAQYHLGRSFRSASLVESLSPLEF